MEIKDLITDIELQECLELIEDTVAKDKEIICKDCSKAFVFTVEEQQFYKERHLREPKRCKECAKKRRKFFRHKGDK